MAQGQNTSSATRSRITQFIPSITNGHINSWATQYPTLAEGYLKNGIVETYSNDPNRGYTCHRPHINVSVPDSVGDGKGRGIYWWSAVNKKYFMNDDVIYSGTYATACTLVGGHTAIASGDKKVYFREWSSSTEDYLFIIDPENDGVYVITATNSTIVINITDVTSGTGAPFGAADSWDFDDLNSFITDKGGLCDGAVALDTYLFLGFTDGTIMNSNVDDWLNWNALGFVTCNRSPDKLFRIAKQQDHVVALGGASIEFLYDNANEAPASPLSFRQDVALRTGTTFGEAVWEFGDTTYFIGLDEGGDFTLYELSNFKLTPIRNNTAQSFLWMTRYVGDLDILMEGFTVGGHIYLVINTIDQTTREAYVSLVYDATTGVWSEWESTVNSQTHFQMIGFMNRPAANDNRPFGMMRNGDLWYPADSKVPYDIVSGGSNVNIPLVVTIGPFDNNTTETKFMHSLNYKGNQPQSAYDVTVEYSDDDGANWLSYTIDINNRDQLNRMGKFTSRRFRFTFTNTQYIRFEGVDVTFSQGGY